jgi:lipoprotein-releasing system ATP-binding protein
MSDSTVLRCSNLKKSFDSESGNERIEVLQGVNLELQRGDLISIVGSSGSGKSTLLHILGGLDRPDSGELYWNKQSVFDYSPDQLAELRNQNVGFVFQFHHLMPEFTAFENVMMPALIKGESQKAAANRAEELLNEFGMGHRLHHRPSQLSGGEQQRVSMARALTNHPSIILADEPTGNLDEENTSIILDLLFKLREIENLSVVLITHEKEIAAQCDKTYILQRGTLQTEDNR